MALSPSSSRAPHATRVVTVLLWLVAVGNLAAVVYLWVHGGGIGLTSTLGGLLTSMGRLTALVGTYLVLVQVVLLARVPWIERRVGFDRLTVWHRRNGKVAVSLVVAHVPLIVAGYALTEHISIGKQISELLKSYPGMITAIIGTVILIVVVLSSLVIVRRRLPYESWYFVHISVYAGILLAYFHQIPTGNEFVAHPAQRDYWYALYVATLALVIVFRVISPALHFWRYRLRVSEVRRESPNVVSIYIEGHGSGAAQGTGRPVLFVALSLGWALVAGPSLLTLCPAGRTVAADHCQGRRRLQRPPGGAASRDPGARRGTVRQIHSCAER